MHILMKRDYFSKDRYMLQAEDSELAFVGDGRFFVLPYSDVRDFSITEDRHGKAYFNVFCSGKLYEGQILDTEEIENFTSVLKDRMGGILNIEVRK